eukprot:TRINITY_DN37534_c0_g1_i1.p2 TRINITY_DN37534_c0_g1~~TRINITY_DN37534_c0_g1_i1.p2  ORF type:complete len:115 (+),score=14.32 TRINITY_DN37534_c0_g1_i1:18-362(+)
MDCRHHLWVLQFVSVLTEKYIFDVVFFFFFSSRRRHTRCREVSWARRCVQETAPQLSKTTHLSFKLFAPAYLLIILASQQIHKLSLILLQLNAIYSILLQIPSPIKLQYFYIKI